MIPFTFLRIEKLDGLQLGQVAKVGSTAQVRIQSTLNFDNTDRTGEIIRKSAGHGLEKKVPW